MYRYMVFSSGRCSSSIGIGIGIGGGGGGSSSYFNFICSFSRIYIHTCIELN